MALSDLTRTVTGRTQMSRRKKCHSEHARCRKCQIPNAVSCAPNALRWPRQRKFGICHDSRTWTRQDTPRTVCWYHASNQIWAGEKERIADHHLCTSNARDSSDSFSTKRIQPETSSVKMETIGYKHDLLVTQKLSQRLPYGCPWLGWTIHFE